MKFFDADWNEVFAFLPTWDKLSARARQHYLLAVPSHAQSISASGYGDELTFVLASGLVENASPNRVKPTARSVPFRRIMAQLAKFPLFDRQPPDTAMKEYLKKHLSGEEESSLYPYNATVAPDSQKWIESFLNAESAARWEKPYRMNLYERSSDAWSWRIIEPGSGKPVVYFTNGPIGVAAQHLVRQALNSPHPLSLTGLGETLPEDLRPHRAAAFKACVRYRLLYPALIQPDLEAVFWIHPQVGYYLHRPKPIPPEPREVASLFSRAFLMDDMVQLLAMAAIGECQLKQEGSAMNLFSKVEAKLLSEMPALPDWLSARFPAPDRLRWAYDLLGLLEMAEPKRQADGKHLQATPHGQQWLKLSARERLRDLILHLRKHRSPAEEWEDGFAFVPSAAGFYREDQSPADVSHTLEAVWRQTDNQPPVGLEDFVQYHSRVSHPLAAPASSKAGLLVGRGDYLEPATEHNVEETWSKALGQFFWERLVPLGTVELGLDIEQKLCFRLNPTGRCLLGLADDFDYGHPTAPGGIVVQPNFEIVFLQPNLAAEIDLAALAERCGKTVGTIFRLTRKTIIQAAAKGMTADEARQLLTMHSAKDLPANVAEEVRAWFAACRRLPVRHALLIEAGDRETALRIRKLLGSDCTVVKDTLLEWRVDHIDSKVRKELNGEGLFLDLV